MFTPDHLVFIANGLGFIAFLVLSLVCLLRKPRLVGLGIFLGIASLAYGALVVALLLYVF